MSNIFINYRREDSSAYAGRLYDALLAHFGRDNIFIDIDTIGPGEDFRQVIQQTCASCEVLLAVIGRSWATIQDKNGKPRLGNETDFVRLEIASALQKDLRVIPVLVGGADMPDASLLPTDLQPLAFRNAWEISDKRFHQDVEGLVDAIKKMLASSATKTSQAASTPVEPRGGARKEEVSQAAAPRRVSERTRRFRLSVLHRGRKRVRGQGARCGDGMWW
jgi:TIR domain